MLRFGPEEKAAAKSEARVWEDGEDAAGLVTALLVFAGAAGADDKFQLASAAVLLAVTKLKARAAWRIAEDPPDAQFREPVIPHARVFRASVFGPAEASPLGRAAEHLLNETAALEAMVTALERAQAATLAADEGSLEARLTELQGFARQASRLLIEEGDVLRPLVFELQDRATRRVPRIPERLTFEAALLEARPDGLGLLVDRAPPDVLAILFRGGLSVIDLTVDAARLAGRAPLMDDALQSPMGTLAASLLAGSATSEILGEALGSWLIRVEAGRNS
jgi:hypothetical protein